MIKVLIVDDELLARLALRTAIEWEKYGFEVVAEAEDGITGFQYVKQYLPDIVLTDISMPGMNGVELVKKTKEYSPDTEIIILSCHNDFDYVKEGLRSGAANYILKLSMSMDELLGELLLLKEKINKKGGTPKSGSPVFNKAQWPGLLFSLMAQEELTDMELLENARKGGLMGPGDYVVMAVVTIDKTEEEFIKFQQGGIIENLAEAVMARYRIGTYVSIERNQGIVLCQMESQRESGDKIIALKSMLSELLDLLQDCHGISASAGLSEVQPVSQMKAGYRQAYNALLKKFFTGPGRIHSNGEEAREQAESNSGNGLKEIFNEISAGQLPGIQEETMRWLDHVAACQDLEPSEVRKNIHELLFQIDSSITIDRNGQDGSDFVKKAYHKIQKQAYLDEMRSTLEEFFAVVQEGSTGKQSSKREIMLAQKFVRLNYQNNIKLSDVAAYVNMNGDYFSHLFKKETGVTFSAYLNEYRIERSKSLLQSGRYKVYEAAYTVGFQDENYFIKCFKKQTGCTPLEFVRS